MSETVVIMRIAPAERSEQSAALQFLFAHLPRDDARARIEGGLALLRNPDEPPGVLLVARADRAIHGAVLAQVLPGATGVLWPPCAAAVHLRRRHQIEDALLREALGWMRRGGARLAQAVLAGPDLGLGDALLRGGFTRPTKLIYLESWRTTPFKKPEGRFEPYPNVDPELFHDTLAQTYEGSLDFPEIDGRRCLREVLRGYQAAGFDPARWWLRYDDEGRPAGVLILSLMPDRVMDLTYLGVVPAARRRGLGRALVRKALAEAHSAGAVALTVAVDARNEPALRLYREFYFVGLDERDVFLMADLGP